MVALSNRFQRMRFVIIKANAICEKRIYAHFLFVASSRISALSTFGTIYTACRPKEI